MKKSVVITIIAIYIISIVLVATLGINSSLDYEKKYVTGIDGSHTLGYVEYTKEEADTKGCNGIIEINADEFKPNMKITLDFRPIPGNADEKILLYNDKGKSQDYCEIIAQDDGTATLIIKEQTALYIDIISQDNYKYQITIMIAITNPDW